MDAIILDKLIHLMPLWAIIIIAIMFVGMKFYYTRFAKLEDTISKLEDTTSKLEGATSKLEDTVSRTDDRLRWSVCVTSSVSVALPHCDTQTWRNSSARKCIVTIYG